MCMQNLQSILITKLKKKPLIIDCNENKCVNNVQKKLIRTTYSKYFCIQGNQL